MSGEKTKGPTAYFDEAEERTRNRSDEARQAAVEAEKLLNFFQELRLIGELDTKLQAVIKKFEQERGSSEDPEAGALAIQKFRELKGVVEALAKPDQVFAILKKTFGATGLMVEAMMLVDAFEVRPDFRYAEQERRNEIVVKELSRILNSYLDSVIEGRAYAVEHDYEYYKNLQF